MNPISTLEEINIEGFQVVRSDMFLHLPRKVDAACSIWPTKIAFSKQCLVRLNNCEYVRLEINPTNKCLLLIPVTSKDKDSIRWVKGQKERTTRNMESRTFGKQLYQTWKLDSDFNYRATGKLVTVNEKIMMLFDFSHAESWRTKTSGVAHEKN